MDTRPIEGDMDTRPEIERSRPKGSTLLCTGRDAGRQPEIVQARRAEGGKKEGRVNPGA